MTAAEAIRTLQAEGAHEPIEYFLFLANHAHELRLANGGRLNDGTDWKAFLRELAETSEALDRKSPRATDCTFVNAPPKRMSSKAVDLTCPRCGHVHQGESECGEALGGGRVCRCELEVPA